MMLGTNRRVTVVGFLAFVLLFQVGTFGNLASAQTDMMPDWFKNNAKWWKEGLISDQDIINGIESLIVQDVIKVELGDNPQTSPTSSVTKKIPSYIKNVFGFWSDGTVSGSEISDSIQYLIKEDIIQSSKINEIKKKKAEQRLISQQKFTETELKAIYSVNKWYELSAEWLLSAKNGETELLDDAKKKAWDVFSKTKDKDVMNDATLLEDSHKKSKQNAFDALGILNDISLLEDEILEQGKKQGISAFDFEKEAKEQQQKIDDVKQSKTEKEIKDAKHEAKKASKQAKTIRESTNTEIPVSPKLLTAKIIEQTGFFSGNPCDEKSKKIILKYKFEFSDRLYPLKNDLGFSVREFSPRYNGVYLPSDNTINLDPKLSFGETKTYTNEFDFELSGRLAPGMYDFLKGDMLAVYQGEYIEIQIIESTKMVRVIVPECPSVADDTLLSPEESGIDSVADDLRVGLIKKFIKVASKGGTGPECYKFDTTNDVFAYWVLQEAEGKPPRDLEVHGIFISPDGKSRAWGDFEVINGKLETRQFASSGPGTYSFMFTSIVYPSNRDSLDFGDSTVYIKIPACPQNSVPSSLDDSADESDLDSVADNPGVGSLKKFLKVASKGGTGPKCVYPDQRFELFAHWVLQDVNGDPPRRLDISGTITQPKDSPFPLSDNVMDGEISIKYIFGRDTGTYIFEITEITYHGKPDKLAFEDTKVYVTVPECPSVADDLGFQPIKQLNVISNELTEILEDDDPLPGIDYDLSDDEIKELSSGLTDIDDSSLQQPEDPAPYVIPEPTSYDYTLSVAFPMYKYFGDLDNCNFVNDVHAFGWQFNISPSSYDVDNGVFVGKIKVENYDGSIEYLEVPVYDEPNVNGHADPGPSGSISYATLLDVTSPTGLSIDFNGDPSMETITMITPQCTGSSVEFDEIRLIDSLQINGQYYPYIQFIVAAPDSCGVTHYHSITEHATSQDLTITNDPNIGGCGFGTVSAIPRASSVYYVSEILAWEETTGIDIPGAP